VRTGRLLLAIALAAGPAAPSEALETDQFYAWTRPLADATDAVNAEINARIEDVLADVNTSRRTASCRDVAEAIHHGFEYANISRFEVWAMQTALVERAPADPDEESAYRREWIYGETPALDPIRWMPPSPTIEVAGIRVGLDKIGHFLCEGASAEKSYRRARRSGVPEDEAVMKAMRLGILAERTVMGNSSSGVFSPADLEADFQGLSFYRGLCDAAAPALQRMPDGWHLGRPFDLRDYVTPEWDESWQPNVYSPGRWTKVRLVMRRHCDELSEPEVRKRRSAYRGRDRETTVEAIIRDLVAAGKLGDPAHFAIEAACAGTDRP
jgi:hypothetical protein